MATTLNRFNQLELINFIASNTDKFDIVVILADDDRTPMEAIKSISSSQDNLHWSVEISDNSLLVY